MDDKAFEKLLVVVRYLEPKCTRRILDKVEIFAEEVEGEDFQSSYIQPPSGWPQHRAAYQ